MDGSGTGWWERLVWGALGATLGASLLLAAPSAALAQPARLKEAEAALERGRYDEADRLLQPLASQKANYDAKVLDARLKLLTGDYDNAELQVKRALAHASGDDETARAVLMRGEIEALRGDYEAAVRSFARVAEEFEGYPEARVRLGETLLKLGRKEEARRVLDSLADDYNAGKHQSAAGLTLVGLAVWRLEYFEDANDVFNDAVDKDPTYIPAYVAWGHLFLEKYNVEDATFAFEKALKVNPRHPAALLGLAEVYLTEGADYRKAGQLIDDALQINPRLPEAFVLKAQLQIDSEDYDGALATLDKALKVNPNHLDALTLAATCHYLKDDAAGFEKIRKRVFKINPKAASFYTTVAQWGVRVHRYEEAIDLNLQALKVDPSYWPAFVDLGIGYTRIGDDRKGFDFLKKAFDNDPFNVRAFNMVNLYEKTLPEYVFVEHAPLRLRYHRSEREVLDRVVPPLLEEAWGKLVKRYRFTPSRPVSVEIFRSPETFSVRSVGLPSISPHGICFGKVVTARSPSAGDFNWAEVLWHELAHVFHIQLSRSRVPRWFTEGLAEYEASQGRGEWRREQDLEIIAALAEGNLLSVRELNRGFTQARTLRDIITAYFQSTLLIEFMVNQAGFDAVVEALKLYGKGKTTPEVLRLTTGMDVDAFDRAFRSWLDLRYNVLINSFEPSLPLYDDLPALAERAKKSPKDARAQAEHAMGLFRARRIDEAEAAFKRALKLDPKQPLARFLSSVYAARLKRSEEARADLNVILGAGLDGYSVQLQLGQLAQGEGRSDEALTHLYNAARFYPQSDVPWRLIAELQTKAGRKEEAAAALDEITRIEQSDFDAARRLYALRVELKDPAGALRAAERAVFVRPFDAAAQRELGLAALQAGDFKRAVASLEVALALIKAPAQRGEVLARLVMARAGAGDKRGAREALQQAEALDPNNPLLPEARARVEP